jgi:CarD family transcriptional regulator
MFQIGERIMYGCIGVCEVADIRLLHIAGTEEKEYYVLRPLHIAGEILIPTNTSIFMRQIMSVQEANCLIDQIPSIHAEPYFCSALTELSQHYERAIHSQSCADLVALAMSIFAKRKIRADHNQKAGIIDEKYLKRTENLIFSELSIVLEIPKEDVSKWIVSRVNARKKEKQHASDS